MADATTTPTSDDHATLDRIEVAYEIKATFVITAGVYSGLMSKRMLADHIADRGIQADDIDSVSIIEVRLDDDIIATADVADND
jgi:hypothetical protein